MFKGPKITAGAFISFNNKIPSFPPIVIRISRERGKQTEHLV
jgi:hypothetical protein